MHIILLLYNVIIIEIQKAHSISISYFQISEADILQVATVM
jgi:hypothetical protein